MKNWIINLSAAILLCGTLVTATSSATAAQPSVRLPEYFATGFYNTTAKNNKATLYLGLPFAQPPKGILRFEKTVPLFPDLLFRKHVSATKWPKACHQVINATSMGIFSDEDCLYLNVMAPPNKSATLLPVFVFIHGGGYEYGLTEEYGWEYFVDNFITQNVIMVTLQYRLAHFGFFATEDGVINGNFGHFDQVEALKFIKRNIKAFGGDPNRITLSGHSAGSSAVHSVSLSPKSRGLFNQELRISGSDYAQWAINNRVVYKQSKMVSDAVGCKQANTHLRKICLKTKHYGDFWNARNTLNLTDFPLDNLDIIYWTSVFDNDFFEGKNLSTLQKEAPKRPTLYGIDAGEGMLWSFYGENPITNVFSFGGRGFTTENRTLCTPQFIHDFLHQQLFYYSSFTEQQKTEIIDRIFEHYKIGEQYGQDDPLYHWYKLTDLYSDFVYKVPHSQEVEYKLENGFDNQYFYVWNYTRPQDRPLIGDLPGHGYFLMYFAGLVIYTNNGLSHSPADVKAQEHLQDLFVSFIKTGLPVSGGVAAEKITASRIPYLEIRENVIIDDVTFKPKQIFWDQLNADYNYNFFKGVPLGQNA